MYNNDYGIQPPHKITEERFFYMLEVLPPCRWSTYRSMESFHVSEHLSGDVVSWFARLGADEFWEMQDLHTLSKEVLSDKFFQAIKASQLRGNQ